MPKGFNTIKEAGKDIEERKNASQGDFPERVFFKLDAGETATVRFLEQGDEVQWAWVHSIDDGSRYGRKVVCRDQDDEGRRIAESCPGCEQNLARQFRGAINVIWRGTNKHKEGSDDVVAIWTSGPRVFVETLDPLDSKYRGLGSRDFEVTRRGTEKDTSYSVMPADPDGGAKAMSASDKKLAEDKNDLSWYVEPPSYETWGKTKKEIEAAKDPADIAEYKPDPSPFADALKLANA